MLPDPDNCPAGVGQCLVGAAVASHVRVELLLPPGAVGLWHRAVLWAAMPEASVDEHGDLRPYEDDVGLGPRGRDGSDMEPVSESTSEQFLSEE